MTRRLLLFALLLGSASCGFAQLPGLTPAGCSGNGAPTAGCNGVGSMPLLNTTDVGAQTVVVDPLPATVSTLGIRSTLYAGANPRIICEYQPWFCNTSSPCNGHLNVGMDESNSAQVLAQLQDMKNRGCDVVAVDYYGCGADCGQTSSHAFELSVTKAVANQISANPSTTPKLLMMIDQGAINGSGTGQCAPAGGDQSACLIAAINLQNDYICNNWLYQSYYETYAGDGHPLVLYFIGHGAWGGTNFSTVYGSVKTHATSGNSCGGGNYTTTVDFADENNAGFTETGVDGGYAWPQPVAYGSSQQFCWQYSGGCSFDYLADFYSHARGAPSKIAIGVMYKGFDDNRSFGTNRVIAQQCAQVWLLTAGKIGLAGYSSSSQIPYVQVSTWNDKEEGTSIEDGIDNCYRLATPTISGGVLSWSLVSTDQTYASTSTISSYSIYTGTVTPTSLYASGISPSATSYSPAPTLSPGQNVWVYMIGQSNVQNQLSPPVSTSAIAPGPSLLAQHF